HLPRLCRDGDFGRFGGLGGVRFRARSLRLLRTGNGLNCKALIGECRVAGDSLHVVPPSCRRVWPGCIVQSSSSKRIGGPPPALNELWGGGGWRRRSGGVGRGMYTNSACFPAWLVGRGSAR